MSTQIWAHRGASAYAPENTIEAFEKAIQMGAHGIELDVHMSADDALMILHDETVDRTSNGSGRVVDQTCAALKRLDFSNGFSQYSGARIPTLQEVFELVRPTSLLVNIELKCDVILYLGIWDKVMQLEKEMNMEGRILYSSFNHYVLLEIRKLDPHAQIGLLYGGAIVDPWVYAKYLKANAVHPHYLAALNCPGLIEGCKKNDVAIHTWTADDPNAIQKLVRAQIEAVITNKPDVALEVMAQNS